MSSESAEFADIQVKGERLENPNILPSEKDLIEVFRPDTTNLFWLEFIDNNYKKLGYEILTQEYVAALGEYISKAVDRIKSEKDDVVTILEVGGGNGRLSKFLKEYLSVKNVKANIICTDTKNSSTDDLMEVESLPYDKAIEKYHPEIIICSWMPAEQDWTPIFRENKNLKEYILIGALGGRTGTENSYSTPQGFSAEEICTDVRQFSLESSPHDLTDGNKIKKSKTFSFRKVT